MEVALIVILMLPNESGFLLTVYTVNTHSCPQKERLPFIRMVAIWGDGGLSIAQKTLAKILFGHESFKGK